MAVAEHHAGGKYVALYLRISRDQQGREEGVGRQEKWGRAYAAQRWPALQVRVFSDNNVSAFDDGAVRPGYDALRAAVVAKEVEHLWTVEQTRLEANRRRWIDLTIDLEAAGITEIHTNRDGVVRLDEVADIKNVLSYRERRRLRERLRDTMDEIAAEGRPVVGSLYGYSHGVDADGRKTLVVEPTEAAVLRWMTAALLGGWNREQVAARLNEFNLLRTWFGMPGCYPKRAGRRVRRKRNSDDFFVVSPRWVGNKVRSVLTKPTIAGKRVHRGEIVRDGKWEPILDAAVWRRLCSKLEQTPKPGARARSYLLTGFLECSCGHRMTGRKIGPADVTWSWQYYCMKDSLRDGCGKRSIGAEPLERYVAGEFLAHIDTPEVRQSLAADTHAARRDEISNTLGDIETQRRSLAKRWGAGELSDDEWDTARAALEGRRSAMASELASLPTPAVDLDVDEILAGWDYLTGQERRHLLGLWVDRIVVHPATRRGRVFDTDRIKITWAG